ncbi:MAG: hypothetical protein WCF17_14165 [Terracidiphilus sp.]
MNSENSARVGPLLDPDGPHDIPLPPRGWLQLRRVAAFLDDPVDDLLSALPDWSFNMFASSGSLLRVVASDSQGHRVEVTGADPNELHRKAADLAKMIEDQCKTRA